MKPFPETPPLSDASLSGHLWIQEHFTGRRLRFQVAESGLISFGDADRAFDMGGDVPLPYRRAADYVREKLDLSALRNATDEPETVTFFGVATLYEGVEYDWDALPPFVGVDIWSEEKDSYLPPDAVTRAYEAVGLPALPAVEKEASAKYTDLDGYMQGNEGVMPVSAYREDDGTVAGVLVRDKSGGRGEAWREVSDADGAAEVKTPEDIAAEYVTDERIDGTVGTILENGKEPSVDAVLERVLSDTVRENYSNLYSNDEAAVSEKKFRSAVAERVQRRLG